MANNIGEDERRCDNPTHEETEVSTVPKSEQQQQTYKNDDEESVVIKVIVPGSEDYNNTTNNSKGSSKGNKERNGNGSSRRPWKDDRAHKRDRLYCWGIIILSILLIAAVTVTTTAIVLNRHRTTDNSNAAMIGGASNATTVDGSGDGSNRNDGINSSKAEWPELMNTDADIAKAVIVNDRPDVQVYIVEYDSLVTTDYRIDRVRIFVDSENVVVQTPVIG